MKKLLIITILLLSFQAKSQEKNLPKSEVKLNVLYLIAGIPEIGYEYLINNESGVGVNIMFSIVNDYNFKFSFTPYYRYYLGEKRAAGFFVEGFGMVNTIDEENYEISPYDVYYDTGSDTDFALGISAGGKFLTKKNNFLFEIYGGIGRNLFDNNGTIIVPRFGFTFGKRF